MQSSTFGTRHSICAPENVPGSTAPGRSKFRPGVEAGIATTVISRAVVHTLRSIPTFAAFAIGFQFLRDREHVAEVEHYRHVGNTFD